MGLLVAMMFYSHHSTFKIGEHPASCILFGEHWCWRKATDKYQKIYRSFDFFACGERKDDDHFKVINFRSFDARSIRSILINNTGYYVNSNVKRKPSSCNIRLVFWARIRVTSRLL